MEFRRQVEVEAKLLRKNMPDDGVFNISQNSDHSVDNDVESNDSQVNLKDVDDNGDGLIFYSQI